MQTTAGDAEGSLHAFQDHHEMSPEAMAARLRNDIIDGFDEELELEIDEDFLSIDGGTDADRAAHREQRRAYFRELFRLQGELVKLQDWVQHTRHRVVILFEGRDAAGKGGVIKRITQRLNPRASGRPSASRISNSVITYGVPLARDSL